MRCDAVHKMTRYLVCLLVGFALLGLRAESLKAQNTAYGGIDVLFLVDQSGSMGGAEFGSPGSEATDPLGLRFEAVQYALTTLSEYRRLFPTDTTFRMAVVSFGDEAEVALPWTTIESGADWQAQQDALLEQLSEGQFGERNLGNTNFIGAFEQADQLFDELPAPDDGNRSLKSVIVLTDGAPCAPALFDDPSCSTPSDQNQHMLLLADLAEQAFPAPDFRVYTIAIDDNNAYWDRFQTYWQTIVGTSGTAERVENSTAVGRAFLEIMLDLVAVVRGSESDDGDRVGEVVEFDGSNRTSVDIPPYYQSLRVTVFKALPESGLVLTTPDGTVLTEGFPSVTLSGVSSAIEVWTVSDPLPGTWQLSTPQDASLVDVYLDLIRVDYDVSVDAQSLTRYVPVDMTLSLLDSNGDPLPTYDDPRFALEVQATLQTPSGSERAVPFSSGASGRYTAQIVPEQSGDYTLSLMAATDDLDGNRLEIVEAPTAATFSVGDLQIEATKEPAGDLLLSQEAVIDVTVDNADGTPLGLENLAVDIVVRGPQNERTLRANPTDSGYRLPLTINDTGQYQIVARAILDQEEPLMIGEAFLPSFQVAPANFVLLDLESPADEARLYTSGMLPGSDRSVDVALRATNQDGEPVALGDLVDGDLPINLRVENADGERVVADAQLTGTDEVGQYTAAIQDLPTGDYTISVRADTDTVLRDSTLFDPRTSTQTATVALALNPAYIGFMTGAGIAIMAIVGVIAWRGYLLVKRRRHPASGRLEILQSDPYNPSLSSTEWTYSLDGKNSNYHVVSNGTLKRLGIGKMIVESRSERMAKRSRVHVTIFDTEGKQIFSRAMGKNSQYTLSAISSENLDYLIAKDVDDLLI